MFLARPVRYNWMLRSNVVKCCFMSGELEMEMRELTLVVSEEAHSWLGRVSGQQALDFYLIYISGETGLMYYYL